MNLRIHPFLAFATGAALSIAFCASASGVEKPTQVGHSNPETKAPTNVPKYELKNKSLFTIASQARAPFWPIGWIKRPVSHGEVREKPRVAVDESAFSVTSILMGVPSLAVINGRAYSEGEFIRMPKDGSVLRIRVQSINDGSVTLQCEDQTIVVSLRRPQLAERRNEVDLLDPDR